MEKELKRRAKNIAHTNNDDDPEEHMNQEEQDNAANEILLSRLYKVAEAEHQAAVRFEGVDDEDQENEAIDR